MGLGLATVALSLPPRPSGAQETETERPRKSLSLGAVADAPADPARARLEAAVALLKSERYEDAAVQLHELAEAAGPVADDARYQLGKALYRLGHHHAALHHFALLLGQGPAGRFHRSSLEWCLFLSRKMIDGEAVDEVVARHATGEFPEEYRDEFFFRLARFHYVRALQIETGAIAGQLGETRVEEKATGGKSFQGDIFGDDAAEEAAPRAAPKPAPAEAPAAPRGARKGGKGAKKAPEPEAPRVTKKEGGGLSIDSDLFGEGEGEAEAPVAKPAPTPPAPKPGREEPPEPGQLVLTAKEHTEAAERAAARVADTSAWGARARFLEGLLLYKGGRANDALDAFKKVVRLSKDLGEAEGARLREAAFFQLARTHFGAQQPSFSIFYYDKVQRETWAWLDALYEASWAEFRLGGYERALGNLLTLHSPFFADLYYPESQILKAVIYYENCRYPEAKDILTAFLGRYEPVLEELRRLTAKEQGSAQYYEILQTLRTEEVAESGTEKARTVGQVLEIALADPELKRRDAAYAEVEAEIALLERSGFAATRLGEAQRAILAGLKASLAREAGRAVRKQLEREREAIKLLVQQAIRIDVETSRSEQERIESELREVQSRPKEIARDHVDWTDDERLVWPFEGEYWRDELGTYQLTLAHTCR
jgi:tetratricopeptide (TPR) repeat protein